MQQRTLTEHIDAFSIQVAFAMQVVLSINDSNVAQQNGRWLHFIDDIFFFYQGREFWEEMTWS